MQIPQTMKAVVTTGNGGYDRLDYRDVPVPQPGPGEVLLQVLAAGINNTEVGWGRALETWSFMAALEELGGETWFQLGDKDLATNVERSRRLSKSSRRSSCRWHTKMTLGPKTFSQNTFALNLIFCPSGPHD